MPMEDTFSPVLHRLSQAIRFRAVHSVDAVPPPSEILTKFSNPPQELAEKASKYLDRVRNAADVKRGMFSIRMSCCRISLTRLQYHRNLSPGNATAAHDSKKSLDPASTYLHYSQHARQHKRSRSPQIMQFQNSARCSTQQKTWILSAEPSNN